MNEDERSRNLALSDAAHHEAAMKKTEQLTDIEERDVDRVVANFEAIGASVRRFRQSNGKWTVTAVMSESSLEQYSS